MGRRRYWALPAAILLLAGVVAIELTPGESPPPPNRTVPDQFVARMLTSALGRVPEQADWQAATEHFRANGCTVDTLREWARDVYLSDAYGELGYDPYERTLTLYAGALAREPDDVGLHGTVAALARGDSWEAVVDRLLGSEEFGARLGPTMCSGDSPAYAPAASPPPPTGPPRGVGFRGDQAGLQAALNATPPGGTLTLAQRAVIRIEAPLQVPENVKLETAGRPPPEQYARQARLVRAAPPPNAADSEVVQLASGARLRNVWVSGGRSHLGTIVPSAVNVLVQGDAAAVEGARLDDPLGGGNVFVSGPQYGIPCRTAVVRGNVVTAYSSEHTQRRWADGISVACPRATIAENQVLDATDVGIIFYRVPGGVQASTVKENVVIAAGRSAFAAVAADPLFEAREVFSFEGAAVRDNTLWTGDRAHFDIGLALGSRAWFGHRASKGFGASFTENTTGSLAMRTPNPFLVSGMLDATVEDNELDAEPVDANGCPDGKIVSAGDGFASGSIDGPTVDVPASGCIESGH